jgi:glutathione S-transferase
MKLYFCPGSCSLASHAALEEAGLHYEAELVDLNANAQQSDDFRKINPFGRVPALQLDDGTILTENVAILTYISELVPNRQLLPRDGIARFRALEVMAMLSNTVHVAFRPIFRSYRFANSASARTEVVDHAVRNLNKTLALLAQRLGKGPYVLGDLFSLCDIYLYVFILWTQRPELVDRLGHQPSLEAFAGRMAPRRSIRVAMGMEAMASRAW